MEIASLTPLTATAVRLSILLPSPSSPYRPEPQHRTVLSSRTPQTCAPPPDTRGSSGGEGAQPPFTHSGVSPEQETPQAPQFRGSLAVRRQPQPQPSRSSAL